MPLRAGRGKQNGQATLGSRRGTVAEPRLHPSDDGFGCDRVLAASRIAPSARYHVAAKPMSRAKGTTQVAQRAAGKSDIYAFCKLMERHCCRNDPAKAFGAVRSLPEFADLDELEDLIKQRWPHLYRNISKKRIKSDSYFTCMMLCAIPLAIIISILSVTVELIQWRYLSLRQAMPITASWRKRRSFVNPRKPASVGLPAPVKKLLGKLTSSGRGLSP